MSGTKLTRTQDFTAALGGTALDGLMRTTSVRTEGEENFRQFWREKRPVVFTLWHGRLLPCTYHHRHQDVVTLVSHHRDGEYITRLVQKWGYTAVRGSSSRGGLDALRELVRHLRGGRSLAITPDGPRGPREKLKPGPLLAAQLTGAPIIPVASGASRASYFGGWDRFLIPHPFARLQIAYGEPVYVPRRADEAELQAVADEVEGRLGVLMRRVDQAW
ncbi:MAG TPA: lysophospholipid acyltransferase family protein [Longimicrobium sp.]